MEPASTKRFRFRLSLRGIFGATTFLATVLAGLRASDLYLIEEGMVIAWALAATIGCILASASLRRLALAGFLWGAAGICLPAIIVYAKYGQQALFRVHCAYPILALTLLGSIAGAMVGFAAWLCVRPRRLVVAGVACVVVGLSGYGWRSLAYWHPLRKIYFEPMPLPLAISSDGRLMACDGETVQAWDTTTGRPWPVQFGKPESTHASSYTRLRFLACDGQYLVAGRWGQNALHVFAIDSGQDVTTLLLPVIGVRFCRFVGDGRLVICWCESGRDKIGVWDSRTWDRQAILYEADRATNIMISSDLSTVVTGDAEQIQITRVGEAGLRRLPLLAQPAETPWQLSSDGRWLASNNQLTDLTTDATTDFEEIAGFSADSALVISLSRRSVGDWFDDLPGSIRTAPLLNHLRIDRAQYQLAATEMSSGRIVAWSPWLDGGYGQITLAEGASVLALGIDQNKVQFWRIPNGR
jgi:hypothetical protein